MGPASALVLAVLTRETITLLIIMALVAVLCFLLLLVRTNPRRSSERSVLAADQGLTPGALRGYILALVDAQRFSEAEEVLQVHLERLPGDSRFQAAVSRMPTLSRASISAALNWKWRLT